MSTSLIVSGLIISLAGMLAAVIRTAVFSSAGRWVIIAGVGMVFTIIGIIVNPVQLEASKLALSLNELPSEWQVYSECTTSDGPFEGYFERTFVTQGTQDGLTYIDGVMVCRVKVLPSEAQARQAYADNITFADQEECQWEDLPIADDAFTYEAAGMGFGSVIREGNVVGIIQMSNELYGGSPVQVKEFAGMLEDKLNHE
jgi:hypothetical protein